MSEWHQSTKTDISAVLQQDVSKCPTSGGGTGLCSLACMGFLYFRRFAEQLAFRSMSLWACLFFSLEALADRLHSHEIQCDFCLDGFIGSDRMFDAMLDSIKTLPRKNI